MHTADFFVIYKDFAVWIECKTEGGLQKLSLKSSNRFQIDETESGYVLQERNMQNNLVLGTDSIQVRNLVSCSKVIWSIWMIIIEIAI